MLIRERIRHQHVGQKFRLTQARWWEHRDLNPDRLVSSDQPLISCEWLVAGIQVGLLVDYYINFLTITSCVPVHLEPAILPG